MLLLVYTFGLRTVFITKLGIGLVGIDSLFLNILSMLSLSELGIGMAIQYSLYKPIADKDHSKINAIMDLYRSAYRWIACIVLVLGVLTSFALPFIAKDPPQGINLTLIFYLFLSDTVLSYLYSYNRTLLVADQLGYTYNRIDSAAKTLLFAFQMAVLLLVPNYYAFLIVKILINLGENIYLSRYVEKKYPFLKTRSEQPLEKSEKGGIVQNVGALFFHKIGDFCINSTANIIIAACINVASVGIFNNYMLVLAGVNTFVSSAFNELTASLGNLVVTESGEKRHQMVKTLNFIGFCVYGVLSVMFYNLLDPLIRLWVGSRYWLPPGTLEVLLLSQFLTGMRIPLSTFKTAAGVFQADKWIPLVQSGVNLVFALLLVRPMGIAGVLWGNVLSSVLVASWNRPYIVYRHVLQRPVREYFIQFGLYSGSVLLMALVTRAMDTYFVHGTGYLAFAMHTLMCGSVSIGLVMLLYHRTPEFKHCMHVMGKAFGMLQARRAA